MVLPAIPPTRIATTLVLAAASVTAAAMAAAAPTPQTAPPAAQQASPALPGATPHQQKGDREVLFFANLVATHSGGGETPGGGSSTSAFGSFFFNYGRFISERNEIGGGPSLTVFTSAGSTSGTLGVNVFFRRYFPPASGGRWYPYAGADLFVTDFSPGYDLPEGVPDTGISGPSVLDVTYFQLVGGAKNYLTEQLALDLKGTIGISLGSPGDSQSFQATFGLSYVF